MGKPPKGMEQSNMYATTDPSSAAAPTQPPASADEAEARRSSAVLLVARDLSIDEPCRDALSEAGVGCVFTVSNSDDALQLLQRSDLFDAVVIGVGPGDSGAAELAERIRRDHSETATVVVSQVQTGNAFGSTLQVRTGSEKMAQVDSKSLRGVFSRAIATTRRHRRADRSKTS